MTSFISTNVMTQRTIIHSTKPHSQNGFAPLYFKRCGGSIFLKFRHIKKDALALDTNLYRNVAKVALSLERQKVVPSCKLVCVHLNISTSSPQFKEQNSTVVRSTCAPRPRPPAALPLSALRSETLAPALPAAPPCGLYGRVLGFAHFPK